MTETEIISELHRRLTPSRFEHTIGVADTAVRLASRYGSDTEKARLAGLLHDCAKNVDFKSAIQYCRDNSVFLKDICLKEPSLIHAPMGAYMARVDFGVTDEEVLKAIYYHTTGHANMSLLTKILYLADTIEPSRTQAGVELLREEAYRDIDEALIHSIDATIRHIINKGGILDCDTIDARNFLLTRKKKTLSGNVSGQ